MAPLTVPVRAALVMVVFGLGVLLGRIVASWLDALAAVPADVRREVVSPSPEVDATEGEARSVSLLRGEAARPAR